MKEFMLLPAADHLRRQIGGIQQETQTVCPLIEDFLLPGESGRPTCSDICR
jgi:hypothetical protein